MTKYVPIGNRLMDRAWLRDGSHIYTDEAMVLACLMHVRASRKEVEQFKRVQRMLNDPNRDKEKPKPKRKEKK